MREDEALHARKRQLEAQRRHKEEVLQAHEEAEAVGGQGEDGAGLGEGLA